jgi:Zn-dependent peptidase ImmA (M78 family)
VGSCTPSTPVLEASARMREVLTFRVDDRGSSWADAFGRLRDHAEEAGVLVMVNGVVGSNTHRKLDPEEFRGFALSDPLAPLVFINGSDSRAAQIFTLAHELAHLWLGETALSDAAIELESSVEVERWCNRVAAELLVPLADLRNEYTAEADLTEELDRLAKRFRVSTLVVLGRIREAGYLDWAAYRTAFAAERERVLALMGNRGSGGDFYNTQPVRVSKLFARSVIASALEGQTLYRDALTMLGFKKMSTFDELAGRLGVG